MAITPNYSWPLPDDTDLVKDGAEAIRDLGNAIDTTVDGLPSGGLVHINTTSFSAVASQSVNNVFTSDYTNYKLIFDNITFSGGASLILRFRASGTDTTTNYTGGGLFMTHNSSTLTGDPLTTIFLGNSSGTAGRINGFIDIFAPQAARETSAGYWKPYRFAAGSSGAYAHGYSFFQTDATQFDGFSLVATANNVSGSVSVFGYRK